MTENTAPTLDQLKDMLKDELNGDNRTDVVLTFVKQINKHSSDIVKAQADVLKKESEALSGARDKLGAKIWKGISDMVKAELAQVKAKGYTFKLDADGIDYKGVQLLVPTVRKGGGGGGSGVTIQSQTGMRRGELIDKYATDEEKSTIESAKTSAKTSPGSAKWAAEKPVVKRILKDNPELIKH